MTFDTFARLLKHRLTNLCYKIRTSDFGDGDVFYLENYYDDISLFKINYEDNFVQYAAKPESTSWSPIYDYFTFPNLEKLYALAKQYSIDAKEKKIKDKLNEINKDFQ